MQWHAACWAPARQFGATACETANSAATANNTTALVASPNVGTAGAIRQRARTHQRIEDQQRERGEENRSRRSFGLPGDTLRCAPKAASSGSGGQQAQACSRQPAPRKPIKSGRMIAVARPLSWPRRPGGRGSAVKAPNPVEHAACRDHAARIGIGDGIAHPCPRARRSLEHLDNTPDGSRSDQRVGGDVEQHHEACRAPLAITSGVPSPSIARYARSV